MFIRSKVAVTIVMTVVSTTQAFAGGFLADTFVRPFSPSAADAADKWNHDNGQPVDIAVNNGVGAVADVFVPGSGRVVTGGLEIRRHMMNGDYGSGFQGNNPGPMPVGNTMPVGMPLPQVQFGAFCSTMAGRFGPGAPAPLGTFCQAVTDFGQVVSGQVTF